MKVSENGEYSEYSTMFTGFAVTKMIWKANEKNYAKIVNSAFSADQKR